MRIESLELIAVEVPLNNNFCGSRYRGGKPLHDYHPRMRAGGLVSESTR
jgi:hypothetical protein